MDINQARANWYKSSCSLSVVQSTQGEMMRTKFNIRDKIRGFEIFWLSKTIAKHWTQHDQMSCKAATRYNSKS